jgi:hypothetical protein
MIENSCVTLPLEGRRITQLRFDFAFGMEFSDESGPFSIKINTMFTLISPIGTTECDPEKIDTCGPVLRLFNAHVSSAKAFKSGRLEITFSDGVILEVDSNPQFEAWEAVGHNGMRIVAVPGGDLAIWESNSSA